MVALPLWKSHRLRRVPVVTLMPHSRCNCRCIMCDIWKANRAGSSLDLGRVKALCEDLKGLGTHWVVLSGGEALMHRNLWELCATIKELNIKITLLSSGLLLERHAEQIVRWCDEVIVSLDGPPECHDRIRGMSGAYDALMRGIGALRACTAGFPVVARSVVQRKNFREMRQTVRAARAAGCDQISFLAADLSSTAFNRPQAWPEGQVEDVKLSEEESRQFEGLLEEFISGWRDDFAASFIAESPQRLRRIAQYFLAVNGLAAFPKTVCNAPWVSAVVEADGTVRPCFFQPSYGNLADGPLQQILNSEQAVAFRKSLDVTRDPICRRCVCTLKM